VTEQLILQLASHLDIVNRSAEMTEV